MKCEKLFETVDGLYEIYLGVWEDICNLESPHYDKVGVENQNGVRVSANLLDETHDGEIAREEIFTSRDFALYLNVPNLTTYLLKIEAL